MPTSRNNKAFTIVELLVVITVIGILATIAAVSYVGVSAKAKTAAVQSDLRNASQQIDMYKVENSQYPTSTSVLNDNKGLKLSPSNSLLSYTYDDTANYYCLTMKSGTIVTSIKNNAAPVSGYCMRNLVKNGDFSNGTTNWETQYIAGTLSVVSGVAQHVSDGTSTVQYIVQTISTIDVSHKYYVRSSFRSVDYSAKAMLFIGCNISNQCSSIRYNPTYTQNVWYSDSILYTSLGIQDGFVFYLSYAIFSTIPAGMVSQFDNVVMIDLTATFGAGNEPSQAAMDAKLATYPTKWFEGTVIVNK